MDRKLDLVGAIWRKSSFSGDTGGDCVECSPVGAAWRKSSYSGDTGGECVEVAQLTPCIAVRDSKNPDAGGFTVRPDVFAAFVAAARRGEFRQP